jgi:hypothetical protein
MPFNWKKIHGVGLQEYPKYIVALWETPLFTVTATNKLFKKEIRKAVVEIIYTERKWFLQ